MRPRSGMTFRQIVVAACALLVAQSPLVLQAQAPQFIDTGQPIPVLSPGQLESLVAPIALYPDPLLSQVLVAASYPLEIVEAWQWLQRNPGLNGSALTQAAAQQNWDPSVQALVLFPDVIRQLSEDIAWTTDLGNAFVVQQASVMNAVQQMRLQAQQRGSLVSTPQQQVITTAQAGQTIVVIEPANPEVIYVPVYDPYWIWGPPAYYSYPRWHYPARSSGFSFSFGRGVRVGSFLGAGWGGWNSWGWRPAWGNRTVVVNNTFVQRNNFSSRRVTNFTGNTVWSHNSTRRQSVAYPAPAVTQRYRPAVRENLRVRETPAQARVNPSPPVSSFRAQGGRQVEQRGNREIAPNPPNRNRSAFSGGERRGRETGRQTSELRRESRSRERSR